MGAYALYTGASPVKNLTVVVHSRKNFSPAEVAKHETAMKMLEVVLNSVEFKYRLLDRKLVRTNGMTNLQVYELIMTGAEKLAPDSDYEMDLWVDMYQSNFSKVIGYTTPKELWTHLNRKFFSGYSYAEIACNAFHEWLHKIGFDHVSAKDYDSVPYALGYLVEEMIKEMVRGTEWTPLKYEGTGYNQGQFKIPAPEKKLICSRSWRNFFRKTCSWEVL